MCENNQVLDSIETRRSVRKYKAEMPSLEDIKKVIKAGLEAPSGMNEQSAVIVAITNKDIRDKLSKLNARIMGMEGVDPFYGAPVVLVVLANKKYPTAIYDGSVAIENMLLASHSLGLGSCWIHRAKEEFETEEGKEILKKLGLNGEFEGVGHCILGYADENPVAHAIKESRVFYIS